MKIRRIPLSKEALLKMAPAERAFLLLAGHMQNELTSIHKVFAWCLHNPPSEKRSSVESMANGMQAMIYARVLAGKLCEAWEVLGKAFFGTKLSQRIGGKLHHDAQAALKRIKVYFDKSNAIHQVRNSFAFHYSIDEFNTNWEQVADGPAFELILGGTVGNNFDLAAELVANTALLNAINSRDREEAMCTFLSEVQSVAAAFTDLLEGTIIAILEEQFGTGLMGLGSEEEIFPARNFSEIAIPFFYKTGNSG